ncbi:hypothetical protein BDW22DRAFT_1350506 [Trametopsis cervina]|nr:hypothetical protein BDW22DRAFT_1350506 [Trametopsis cervina]
MAKKVSDLVQEPEVVDEEGEESDDYDDIEEDEDEGGAEYDGEDDEEGDEEGLTKKGSNLTALLLGGSGKQSEEVEDDSDDGDEEEDDEYDPQGLDIKGPATEALADPPAQPAIGLKRTREEDEPDDGEELSGDYGEFEENSETVRKKARAAAEES